jgi:hypothetical protein
MSVGYGASNYGPSSAPPPPPGTNFDENNTYPGDIASGGTNQTYILRASGSPYGSVSSELNLPAGTKLYAADGETVQVNGRVYADEVGGIVLQGIDFLYDAGTQADGMIIRFRNTNTTPTTDFRVAHCKIRGQKYKHGIWLREQVQDVDIFSNEFIRTGTTNIASGDPGEIFGQADETTNTRRPHNVRIFNNHFTSTAMTKDTIQLQECGKVEIANCTWTGSTTENWMDWKRNADGTSDYSMRRCIWPHKDNAFVTRQDGIIEDCLFDDEGGTVTGNLDIGVNGQSPNISDFKILRCIWGNNGTPGTSKRVMQLQEANSVDVIMCTWEGGEVRINDDGLGVVIRGCNVLDSNLNNSGTYTCENNKISGGTGWGSCTGGQ